MHADATIQNWVFKKVFEDYFGLDVKMRLCHHDVALKRKKDDNIERSLEMQEVELFSGTYGSFHLLRWTIMFSAKVIWLKSIIRSTNLPTFFKALLNLLWPLIPWFSKWKHGGNLSKLKGKKVLKIQHVPLLASSNAFGQQKRFLAREEKRLKEQKEVDLCPTFCISSLSLVEKSQVSVLDTFFETVRNDNNSSKVKGNYDVSHKSPLFLNVRKLLSHIRFKDHLTHK